MKMVLAFCYAMRYNFCPMRFLSEFQMPGIQTFLEENLHQMAQGATAE